MPHVIIKMWPGRTQEQKEEMAEEITNTIMRIVDCKVSSVSIAIEEIKRKDWKKMVYKPDIIGKKETLIKKPGYKM
jgi:4-oxalocrotonate tautomerase